MKRNNKYPWAKLSALTIMIWIVTGCQASDSMNTLVSTRSAPTVPSEPTESSQAGVSSPTQALQVGGDSIWVLSPIAIETGTEEDGWIPYRVYLRVTNSSSQYQQFPRDLTTGRVKTEEGYEYQVQLVTGGLHQYPIPPGFSISYAESTSLGDSSEHIHAFFRAAQTAHPTVLDLGEFGVFDLGSPVAVTAVPLVDTNAQFESLPATIHDGPIEITLSDMAIGEYGFWNWYLTFTNTDQGYEQYSHCGLWPVRLFTMDGFMIQGYGILFGGDIWEIGPGQSTERRLEGGIAYEGIGHLVLVENNCVNPSDWMVFATYTWNLN